VVAVDIEGEKEPGIVLADDLAPERPVGPWVALLPALDPTTMGWKRRAWYVGEHAPLLFDRNGNAGPTVWSNGRIVGGWAQRPTGEVVVQLLEDVGSDVATAIADESEALQTWLGDTVVTARFPTPVDRAVRALTSLQPTRTVTD
jgi:hypothetical protein